MANFAIATDVVLVNSTEIDTVVADSIALTEVVRFRGLGEPMTWGYRRMRFAGRRFIL